MKKFINASLFTLAITFASNVTSAESNWFIEGNIGKSKISEEDFNETSTSFGINVGYKFTQYFKLFLGYKDLGDSSTNDDYYFDYGDGDYFSVDGDSSLGIDGILIGVAFDIPVSETWSITPELGYYDWAANSSYKYTITEHYNGTDYVETDSGSDEVASDKDLYFGLGMTKSFESSDLYFGLRRWNLDDIDADEYHFTYRFNF